MEDELNKRRRADGPSQARGHSTRRRILDSAERLFLASPAGGVSVAAIAAAADAFPSQVTYYFGSKDSLFIHAAFLALLHDAKRVEAVGLAALSPSSFRRAMARTVLILPSMPLVVRALAVGTSRPDLAPVVDQHLNVLFRQSERYLTRLLRQRHWQIQRPLPVETRTFWSTAFGAALFSQAGVAGNSNDLDLAGTLTVRSGDLSVRAIDPGEKF
ncbi:TetR/AcrR family transcriptional regulator C-terminal domain-containing protein [Arthrobacter sp. CAN_C5]|uniref:TetR/AcrR family transcriptional regulator C-terminal domain-containing protein n=1 Tax=Arthrobacter sp. CAN_C5 TaxID=2760706 RepID=UPI001AEB918E|nr:TetR/AcrR family transcriptional regulator C-terminal domain-containing protein [Arthrobacter sp. CAN_C5]MBP2215075.1 AcrR family transcriptional regulator [Arthrobacter sp. CAN_C5]